MIWIEHRHFSSELIVAHPLYRIPLLITPSYRIMGDGAGPMLPILTNFIIMFITQNPRVSSRLFTAHSIYAGLINLDFRLWID